MAKWRPRLKRWKQVIWNYYRPSFALDLLGFARCVIGAETYWFFTIEVSPPTQDERLEAERILSEWWRDKFPDQWFEEFNDSN